jgi:hypothetical protein
MRKYVSNTDKLYRQCRPEKWDNSPLKSNENWLPGNHEYYIHFITIYIVFNPSNISSGPATKCVAPA